MATLNKIRELIVAETKLNKGQTVQNKFRIHPETMSVCMYKEDIDSGAIDYLFTMSMLTYDDRKKLAAAIKQFGRIGLKQQL